MGLRLDQTVAAVEPPGLGGQLSGASTTRPAATSQSAPIVLPHMAGFPTTASTGVSTEELRQAVANINQGLQDLQVELDIVRDEASGRSAVVVKNADGQVIRQIPPDAVLRAFVQVRRVIGLLLDEAA